MDTAPNPPIFNKLRSGIFSIFSGSNRHFYADLLEYLDSRVLGVSGEIVSRRAAISSIQDFILEQEQEWIPESENEEAEKLPRLSALEAKDKDQRKYLAFNRLISTGWLVIFQDRYRQIVDFDPDARLVLIALLDIKHGRVRSYGGEVLQVLALLSAADGDPEQKSESLAMAAQAAKSFKNHLRSVSGAARKIEASLIEQHDLSDLFSAYFDDFVEKHLIEDFKRLRTRENPFRFRADILSTASKMLDDHLQKEILAESLLREGKAKNINSAMVKLDKDLADIISIFASIDDYLNLINESQQRIDRRIQNATRYMERIGEAHTEHIAIAAELVGRDRTIAANETLNLSHNFISSSSILGDAHLFQKPRKRRKPERRAILNRTRDPAAEAYEKARREYFTRARPTYKTIADYLDRALSDQSEIDAAQLPLKTLDDFFVFERLRDLPYLGEGILRSKFKLEFKPGRLVNEWLECPDFRICRVKLPQNKQKDRNNELGRT